MTYPCRIAILACLAMAPPLLAQEGSTPGPSEKTGWELASAFGLTDLDLDIDAPSSMIALSAGKRLSDRVSLGLEAGSGFIGKTGTCDFGGLQAECVKDSWWPMLDATLRVTLIRPASGNTFYVIGQFGWQGPDLGRFVGGGVGVSFATVVGLDVGLELRRINALNGPGAGGLYFFRIARSVGARHTAGK